MKDKKETKKFRVWKLNDYEYWAGYGLDEVIKVAMKETGCSKEELVSYPLNDIEILSSSYIDTSSLVDSSNDDIEISGRKHFNNLKKNGKRAQLFMCDEF